jgi:hypothetical protein
VTIEQPHGNKKMKAAATTLTSTKTISAATLNQPNKQSNKQTSKQPSKQPSKHASKQADKQDTAKHGKQINKHPKRNTAIKHRGRHIPCLRRVLREVGEEAKQPIEHGDVRRRADAAHQLERALRLIVDLCARARVEKMREGERKVKETRQKETNGTYGRLQTGTWTEMGR